MPITIGGKRYYRTAEACKYVGISRSTFARWLRTGIVQDVETLDRRGWRLFSQSDLQRLQAEANKLARPVK